jgi:hypothetical protein
VRPIGPKPTIATSSPSTKGWRRRGSEATSKWKSFLSRFRSYSATRRRRTFLVLTFGRRSDGQPEARREDRKIKLIDKDRIKGTETVDRDCRSILHVLTTRRAQAVESRTETFAGVFILIMPLGTSVGSHLPRSSAIA